MANKRGAKWWQNRKKRLGKQARRHLPELVAKQGNLCYWCDCPIVVLSGLSNVVRKTADTVEWEDGGERKVRRFATADHIKPLRDGAESDPDNLVASCPHCNRNRTAIGRTWGCMRCGKCADGGSDLCRRCRVQGKEDCLRAAGWEFVLPDRWRHPQRGTLHDMDFALKIQRKHLSPKSLDDHGHHDAAKLLREAFPIAATAVEAKAETSSP